MIRDSVVAMVKTNDIYIIFDGGLENSFHPGEFVTGRVGLETSEEIRTKEIRLDLSGKATVFWSDDKTDYSDEEHLFEHSITLFGGAAASDKVMVLEPGQYEYTFKFKLPENLPSTFEGFMGDVRYKAKVIVQRSLRFDNVKEICFKVIRPLDLNEEPLALRAPLGIVYQKSTVFCCNRGLIDVDLYANRACFVPGEPIVFNGQVLNRTNQDIVETTVRLLQDTKYNVRHTDGRKFRSNCTLNEEMATLTRGRIHAGQVDVWNNVQFIIPAIPESRLDGCNIISTSYFLEISLRHGWRFTRVSLGKQLIVIGNVPLKPPAVLTPRDMMATDGSSETKDDEDQQDSSETQLCSENLIWIDEEAGFNLSSEVQEKKMDGYMDGVTCPNGSQRSFVKPLLLNTDHCREIN